MSRLLQPTATLAGRVRLPADAALAPRIACLAASARGPSEIVGLPREHPVLGVLRALGVATTWQEDSLHVCPPAALQPPESPLDAGADGATLHLLAGLLAGRPFDATLTGTGPLEPLAQALRQLGADADADADAGALHLRRSALRGTEVEAPTADLKAALLLAGLRANGETTVITRSPLPDHEERLLGLDALALGDERRVTVEPTRVVSPGLWVVPRDFDLAAPLLVAAAVVAPSIIELRQVGTNPTRAALLEVLQAMGARLTVRNEREHRREPMADLLIGNEGERLHGLTVRGALAAQLAPHLPLLLVAAAHADGPTTLGDVPPAARPVLNATVAVLREMGAAIDARDDGCTIHGGRSLRGAEVEVHPPPVAFAAAVAALTAEGSTTLEDHGTIDAVWPAFWETLADLGAAS